MRVTDRIAAFVFRRMRDAEARVRLSELRSIGRNVVIDPRVFIWSGPEVVIGNNVQINGYTFIYGGGGVEIGDGVMIGANSVISSVSHRPTAAQRQDLTLARVKLGKSVWLGAGCVVLPGVEIGENSVIGAGSVVAKSIPANVVAVGVPAVVRRSLEPEELHT
jgi:galactoside O-acetyltransferase